MELLGFVAGPFQTNCWILRNASSVTVIDPGYGAGAPILDFLEKENLTLEAIVLTHGHIDHMRDAGELVQATNAPVYIHRDDEFMLDAPSGGVSSQAMALHHADAMVVVPKQSRTYLEHGDELTLVGETYTVRHAPGHSPGSVLLVGKEQCFSGDVLFQGSIGRTDLPGSNWDDMDRTLREQVFTLGDKLQILPGHGPATVMGAEKKNNPFLRKYHQK